MDEGGKEGENQSVGLHVNTGFYLKLRHLLRGDRIRFEMESGKVCEFTVERSTGRERNLIRPVRGTLQIVDPARSEDVVKMRDVGINGSLAKTGQLLADVLEVGKRLNILLPNAVRGSFPSPITDMTVFMAQSNRGRSTKELLGKVQNLDAKSNF